MGYRKFGKYIQKRQLDIPEYAASFVDYKALKKVSYALAASISLRQEYSLILSTATAHQEAERNARVGSTSAGTRWRASSRSTSLPAGQQGHFLLQARKRAGKSQYLLFAEGSRSQSSKARLDFLILIVS